MSVYETSTPQAFYAIRAAAMVNTAGRYAASQYAKKHGVSGLYRLARQLAAVSK